jgi:hypothetical protein
MRKGRRHNNETIHNNKIGKHFLGGQNFEVLHNNQLGVGGLIRRDFGEEA